MGGRVVFGGMAHLVAGVIGVALVLLSLADLINTLISTSTSWRPWWPSVFVGRSLFGITRRVALWLGSSSRISDTLLTIFGPFMLLVLLLCWVLMQIVGFGLIWYGLDNTPGVVSVGDAIYYSGVVFLTVGFGEIVPVSLIPRFGVVIEALSGVGIVALTVGYLPTLYGAYSDRERMLMTLDDGGSDRITPTDLILAWAPDADPNKINEQFEQWELWAAGILETQSSVPLLMFFRSHDRRQNWVTALGLLCDAAMHAQLIVGASDGPGFWFLRRATAIFEAMTPNADLASYRQEYEGDPHHHPARHLFVELYERLDAHGFELHDFDDVIPYMRALRAEWAPRMEYLIDYLVAPRGFWAPASRIESWDTWTRSTQAPTNPASQS